MPDLQSTPTGVAERPRLRMVAGRKVPTKSSWAFLTNLKRRNGLYACQTNKQGSAGDRTISLHVAYLCATQRPPIRRNRRRSSPLGFRFDTASLEHHQRHGSHIHIRPEFSRHRFQRLARMRAFFSQCAVRRGLGLGLDARGLASSSFEGLPILLRTASRTFARPFACILSFRAAMMLMISFGALPSEATSI
jgi:hypothetical protein